MALPKKTLIPSTADSELARLTAGSFLCALRITGSKKLSSVSFLRLFAKAHTHVIAEPEGRRQPDHLVIFTRDRDSLLAAHELMEMLSEKSVKYSLFANGRFQKNKFAMRNMLDCHAQASAVRNPKAHCHQVLEDPMGKRWTALELELLPDPDSPPTERWLLPCGLLQGHLQLDKRVPAIDALEAAANSRCTNLCRFFTTEGFGPIKEVKGPKRYW